MIMNKFDFEVPEEASSVTITNKNINDVFEDDMKYFTNLTELNLKDNYQIPMYKLRHLPVLKSLNLSFNQLENLMILPCHVKTEDGKMKLNSVLEIGTPFSALKILNLSFNKLDNISLERLVIFSKHLKTLDLSGNDLSTIPKDFKLFRKLETLNLANNCFKNTKENILCVNRSDYEYSSATYRIFDVLCKIKSLKYLNLSQNTLKG